jgi:hypothetical protein
MSKIPLLTMRLTILTCATVLIGAAPAKRKPATVREAAAWF